MTTFLERLEADRKDLIVAWDFEDLATRFITRGEAGMGLSGKAPLDLGSPAIWFRADDIVGVGDGNNTGTQPVPEHSGNFVNGWIDGPATGFQGVIFHSGSGAEPLNGHAWVEQPATRSDLALTGVAAEGDSVRFDGDLTFLAVFRASPPDVHASWTLGRKLTGSNAVGIGGPNVSVAGAGFFYSETANDQSGAEDVNAQAWRILIVRRTGSTVDIFGTVDDGSIAKLYGSTITNGGRMIFDGIFSAKNGTESDPGMGLAEAIAYRGLYISDADRLELYNWAAARFGLTQVSTITDTFAGAIADQDEGSELDVFAGELTIGGTGFRIPDVDGGITAWIVANEATLSGATVRRREGFSDVPIDEWAETFWTLRDYGGAGRGGGGYQFKLENVLGAMSGPILEDLDTEEYKLDADLLATETVEFDLEKGPVGWRQPGTLLLWDTRLDRGELVHYDSISGKTISINGRERYRVGKSFVGDFNVEDTKVYHAWARRDSPIELALRMLFTDPVATSDFSVLDQIFAVPGFDDLLFPLPEGYTVLGEWAALTPVSASVTEETSIVRGGSAIRLTSITPSDKAELHQTTGPISPPSGSYFALAFYHYDVNTLDALQLQIVRRSTGVDQDYYDGAGGWSGTPTWIQLETPAAGEWRREEIIFPVAAGWTADNLRVGFRNNTTGGGSQLVDSCHLRGWYSTEPATFWDDGSGDGLGLDVSLFDVEAMERLRDLVLRTPSFDANGDKVDGTAALLLETNPIDDVKDYLERHIFRPFGLWPVTDDQELFFLRRYAETPATLAEIDDAWRKGDFRASTWRRDLQKRSNNLSLATDLDPTDDRYGVVKNRTSAASVAAYGKSKLRKIESRGGRTGLFGFPDYSSQLDLDTAAGLLFLEIGAPNGGVVIRAFYRWRGVSLGQAIRLNAPLPDLAAGTPQASGTIFTLTRRKIDNARGYVELKIRQPRGVLRAAFVAPNSVASTYSTASPADKTHCYIGPDSGEFPDGTQVYTVI